jgi:hypothetical protein
MQLTIRPLTPDLWPDLEDLRVASRMQAPALEAYPFDAELSPSASSTGYASTFARAGFKVVARRDPPRPIMRHDLKRVRDAGKQ